MLTYKAPNVWEPYDYEGVLLHQQIVLRKPSKLKTLARSAVEHATTTIGDGCDIGVGVVLYMGCTIGRDCLIGDQANIREGVVIGDRCVIGQGVSINYDAKIGNEVRIMNGTHITGGMVIGDGTFIGVGVITANDRRREIVDYKFVGVTPPVIGKRCLIGSGAMIAPGVTIGDGAVIGMGALVTRDVAEGATFVGRREYHAPPP